MFRIIEHVIGVQLFGDSKIAVKDRARQKEVIRDLQNRNAEADFKSVSGVGQVVK